jgi:RNA polymerase sigma-70 factor (ECF subfamily)
VPVFDIVAPVSRHDEMSDAGLLHAHVAGDSAAFETLVRRHRDRLWAVALRTLGDREEAADAVQEALISAYRNAGSFRGDAAVTTWLHRIVVNACFDRVRRQKSRPTVELPEVDLPAAPVDTDTALDVRAALARLPEDQRVAIVLVDLEGFSVADAAEVLDVPIGTVKSRCARGRARLAVMLGYLRNPPDSNGVSSVGPDGVASMGQTPPRAATNGQEA